MSSCSSQMFKFCNKRLIQYLDSSQRPFNTERKKKNNKLISSKRLLGNEHRMWDEYAALRKKYQPLIEILKTNAPNTNQYTQCKMFSCSIPHLQRPRKTRHKHLTACQKEGLKSKRSYSEKKSKCAKKNRFNLPKRLQGSTPSVWNEYIALAAQYKPINLGQGFPEDKPPEYMTNALIEIAKDDNALLHQYTRGYGHLRLVQAISKLFSSLICREINPLTEVLVTAGAYEALYTCIMGHVDEGDEVIIIEPSFDCYEPMVKMAGGVPRFIPLKLCKTTDGPISSADWVLDDKELEQMFNEKTKMIIFNTPHNPTGKVFRIEEMEKIATLCHKWNILCLSDEVYEWLVYDGCEHIHMSTLPGMWERTITVGTAGKTFSVTGWKIGWAYGPANLITNMQMVHQNTVSACPTPLQEAVARGFELEMGRLDKPECFFNCLPKELQANRDFMAKALQDAGMKPTIPEGGYFLLADWSDLGKKIDLSSEKDKYRDYKFTKWMTKNLGLQGIPPSAFYSEPNKHLGEDYVRYCFIKKQETLEKAKDLLQKWKK